MLLPNRPRENRPTITKMLRQFYIKKYGFLYVGDKLCPHPNSVTLANYINRSLSDPEMESIKAHLARCKRCRSSVADTEEAVTRFESGTLDKIPDYVFFDVDSHIQKLRRKDSEPPQKK
jgi:hypothetical protein